MLSGITVEEANDAPAAVPAEALDQSSSSGPAEGTSMLVSKPSFLGAAVAPVAKLASKRSSFHLSVGRVQLTSKRSSRDPSSPMGGRWRPETTLVRFSAGNASGAPAENASALEKMVFTRIHTLDKDGDGKISLQDLYDLVEDAAQAAHDKIFFRRLFCGTSVVVLALLLCLTCVPHAHVTRAPRMRLLLL